MTQEQEKAKQLVDKYYLLCTELNPMAWEKVRKSYAKQCAIIHCNESIKIVNRIKKYLLGGGACDAEITELETILTEIEKL